MSGVGVFAGRGDIVLAMGVTFILGMFAGYYLHKARVAISAMFSKSK